jgi:hypothetical protein
MRDQNGKTLLLLPALCGAKRCRIENPFDLQLFGEGDGGARAGAESAAASGAAAQPPAPEAADPGEKLSAEQRRQDAAAGQYRKTDPLAALRRGGAAGGRAAAAPAPQAAAAEPDKDAAFERLIRGDYKEQFAARTQAIIDRRFREAKAAEARGQAAQQLVGRLARQFGVDERDYEAVAAAALRASGAESAPEKQPAAGKTEAAGQAPAQAAPAAAPEKEAPARDGDLPAAEKAAEQIRRGWVRDGEALRGIYPDFALAAEVQNPDFARLLKAGVSVRTAYEACHLRDLLGGAMQYTADRVAAGVAARVADRANRPPENGATPGAGAVLKTDVNSLTRAQREQIERRVAHGERIRF